MAGQHSLGTGHELTADALIVDEITSLAAWESLAPAWSTLWAADPQATPFQSPAWLLAWWRNLGGRELMVWALRAGEQLVGLVPMLVWHDPQAVRRVLLIGTGVSDILDGLLLPQARIASVAAIVRGLETQHERWDVCQWEQLPATSLLLHLPCPRFCQERISLQAARPVLHRPANEQSLLDAIPASQQKKLRYYDRRLRGLGEVKIERADERNFEELFELLVRLHQSRWEARDEAGQLADVAQQAFLHDAAWGLLQLGALRLYVLRCDDQPLAALCALHHARRTFYYLGGFDPDGRQQSPGLVLVGHAIAEAAAEGADEFDFLRGQELYKYRWGARDRLNYRRDLDRRAESTETEETPRREAIGF